MEGIGSPNISDSLHVGTHVGGGGCVPTWMGSEVKIDFR